MRKRLRWAGLMIVFGVLILWAAAHLAQTRLPADKPTATPLALAENKAGKVGDVTVTEEAVKLAEIKSQPATLRVVEDRLSVSGVVQTGGDQVAKVTPKAPGKVTRLLAQIGDRVRPDQPLAILDSADLAQAQSDYHQALAENEAEQKNLLRQRELARLGEFGRPQLEESRSQALTSERDMHQARHHLAEERAALQLARAEQQVTRERLQRARDLKELVSRQDLERILADQKKAGAFYVGASARVEGAVSDLALAEKRWELSRFALVREEKVYRGHFLTSKELVEAEAVAEKARLRLQGAAERVTLLGGQPGQGSQIVLISPIGGIVQELNATLGESLLTEQIAYTVVNLERVWAQLAIVPKDLAKIRVGDAVELTADSAPGRIFRGKVSIIGASSDETTRAIYVRTQLKNPDGALKVGSFIRGSLITDVRGQKLTVPDSALQEHNGRPTLYVAIPGQPGAFEVRHVLLGAEGNHWREISQGLKPGEAVAVNGTYYLKSEALKSSLSDGCCGGD